jgi:hypothetical protein
MNSPSDVTTNVQSVLVLADIVFLLSEGILIRV